MLVLAVIIAGAAAVYVSGERGGAILAAVAGAGGLVLTMAASATLDLDKKIITGLLVILLAGEMSVCGAFLDKQWFATQEVAATPSDVPHVTVGESFNLSVPVPVTRTYLRVTFQVSDVNPELPSCRRQVRLAIESAQPGFTAPPPASPGVPEEISLPSAVSALPLNVSVDDIYSGDTDCTVNILVSASLTNTRL